MSGYDKDGAGIRRPLPMRHFSANVTLLPTAEFPDRILDYQMHMWTQLPLAEFIDQAQEAYDCLINWMMPIPEPPIGETYDVN